MKSNTNLNLKIVPKTSAYTRVYTVPLNNSKWRFHINKLDIFFREKINCILARIPDEFELEENLTEILKLVLDQELQASSFFACLMSIPSPIAWLSMFFLTQRDQSFWNLVKHFNITVFNLVFKFLYVNLQYVSAFLSYLDVSTEFYYNFRSTTTFWKVSKKHYRMLWTGLTGKIW